MSRVLAAIARHAPQTIAARFTEICVAYDGLSLVLFGVLVTIALAHRAEPALQVKLLPTAVGGGWPLSLIGRSSRRWTS